MIGLLLALLAAPAPASEPGFDARVPIRQGKLRCGIPDVQRKTCGTLASYVLGPNDSYVVTFRGVISNDGLIMGYSATGQFRNGELCLMVGTRDIDAATFIKGGVAFSGDALTRMRGEMRALFAETDDREVCNRDLGQQGVFRSEGWVSGERDSRYDKDVIWVDPKDGYTLGPLPDDLT